MENSYSIDYSKIQKSYSTDYSKMQKSYGANYSKMLHKCKPLILFLDHDNHNCPKRIKIYVHETEKWKNLEEIEYNFGLGESGSPYFLLVLLTHIFWI